MIPFFAIIIRSDINKRNHIFMADFIEFRNLSYTYNIYDDDSEYDAASSKKSKKASVAVNVESAEQEAESESSVKTVNAVENANFTIQKGEFVAVVGRNGSGKSTLARMMNALLIPTEGVVYVDGIDTKNEDMVWEIRRHVGMVFQNPDNQIVGTTVEEDVAFGLENIGVPRDEMILRISEALATVKLEKERRTEPHLLSGGQKQRCAIAGITAMRPECIVLDEATAMLDPIGRREVMSLVHKLNREQGITIVHITHHMDEVSSADRVILIDNGHILADTTPRKFFANKKLVEESGLEVPQITELFDILRQNGVEVPEDIISIDEGVSVLSELIGGAAG